MATAAQIIAQRLYDAGCRHAFGIPGGEVLCLMDALAGAGLRFVLVKHENAGGFMAEGVHHIDGAPAVLLATIGPGVANAVNVVANAAQDRVPLIFLSGRVDAAEALSYNHQVFDHQALLRPIVKASFCVADGAVGTLIDKAIAIANQDPPGPVHIDVPIGLAGAQQADNARTPRVPPAPMAPAPGPDLERARAALAAAERPILIAGLEVLRHRAENRVAEFARRHGIPVITTYKAKGVLPEDDDLALGGAGLSPLADSHLLPLIARADLIVLAGYDPIEMRIGWRQPWDPERQTVLEFTSIPNTHDMHHASLQFIGDVGAGLAVLQGGIAPRATWPDGAPAAIRAALAAAFDGGGEWGPAAVCDEINRAVPDDAIATVDSGAHRILLSQVWRCRRPHTLLQSTGLCTMGCALPLAIGAKLRAPDRVVLAFTGDAGLEMCLGELSTARDTGAAIIIVVFVDASLALIEKKQRESGLANVGVDFGRTDFAAVARAYGGQGIDVHDREALRAALIEARAHDSFTLIAARIDAKAYDGAF